MLVVGRSHSFRSLVSTIGVAALAAVFASSSAMGDVIVDANGFESPPYSLGDLEGQEGWQRTVGPANSVAEVQDAVVFSGDQAVRVERAPNEDERWAVPVSGFPNKPIVLIDWDMRVEQTTSTAFGPFFGVEAYDGAGPLGLLGSLGVDATTGDILFQEQDTGFLAETGASVNFGEWNHFQLALDYRSDEYSAYVNDTLLATTGFVDRALGLDDFTDADISAIAAGGDAESQALTGTAFYDNFLVQEIPEPQSLILAVLGFMVALLLAHRHGLHQTGKVL